MTLLDGDFMSLAPDGSSNRMDDLAGLLIVEPEKGKGAEAKKESKPAVVEDDDRWNTAEDEDHEEAADASGTEPDPEDEGDGKTGSEDVEDHEDGEAEEAEDDEADEEELSRTVTVKVDGKPLKVTLKEALAGYQRTKDYTLKTEALANDRKVVETEAVAVRAHREEYSQVLTALKSRLGEVDEPTADQWNALREQDPMAYATEWASHSQRKEQLRLIESEQERVNTQKREEHKKHLINFIADQRVKLLEKVPEWKDPKKAEPEFKAVREYAKSQGFTEQELDQAYDHRMIVAFRDAMRYREYLARQAAAKKKVEQAPAMAEPGTRPAKPTSRREAERVSAQKRFNASGKIDDAVSLILG